MPEQLKSSHSAGAKTKTFYLDTQSLGNHLSPFSRASEMLIRNWLNNDIFASLSWHHYHLRCRIQPGDSDASLHRPNLPSWSSPATASVATRSLAQEQVSGGYCGVGGWLEPLTAPSQEMLSGSLAGYANPFPTPQCAVCISESPFERFWSLETGSSILYFNWVTRWHICLAF